MGIKQVYVGVTGEQSQKAQTPCYKINPEDVTYSLVTFINTIVAHV